ncbi:hypothetical protein C8034_v010968 [Colletotrichum sidae]|uniref:Uncharacterized protein n=1 Tax=Colletotrichum sidae TaxID=1347389 RepID=A0A4R8T100_9PEZI|nr:hypothetical protein C8034_v010968 [Colletotrichum sidae]
MKNYKNYRFSYKSLKKLMLYESNFTIFPSSFEIIIVIFNLTYYKMIKLSVKQKRNPQITKKNLILQNKVFENNLKYFKYILEGAYQISNKVYILKSTYDRNHY